MADDPKLADFRRRTEALLRQEPLRAHVRRKAARLGALSLEDVTRMLASEEGRYLLLAAAGLTRTSLKRAMSTPEAQVVSREERRAYAVKERLPLEVEVRTLVENSVLLRARDISRAGRGRLEVTFRERLQAEGIAIAMSPPLRRVPGLLITVRKPDGVAPDPSTGAPPEVYLEIKNIRRVADDIQKRLYEVAEVSLEMKLLYGGLRLEGVRVSDLREVESRAKSIRASIRAQIRKAKPVVVVFLLCAKDEAERYREGAETFVDRVFFQEEVEECLAFLRDTLHPGTRARAKRKKSKN